MSGYRLCDKLSSCDIENIAAMIEDVLREAGTVTLFKAIGRRTVTLFKGHFNGKSV